MAIDFGGALTGDNYSTGVLAKLNATDIANAVWLDSAYTSYTGTITTGAKRITTGGVIEQYNGSAWVALSVGYVLKAGDTLSGSLSISSAAAQAINRNNAAGTYDTWQYGGVSNGDVGTGNQIVSGGATADFGITSRAGKLVFGTGSVARATIDTSGNFGIGSVAGATGGRSLDIDGVALQPLFILRATSATAAITTITQNNASSRVEISNTSWPIYISPAATTGVGIFSSAGLAVTGLLTPTISGTGVYFSGGDSTVSRRLEFSTTTTTNTGDTQKINALGTTGVLVLQANSSNIATVSSTGLAVTGTLSATGDVTASGGNLLLSSGGTIPLRISGATTGSSVARIQNTGGDAIFGQESSAGNNIIIGCSAYDTIIRGPSGLAFSANAGSAMQMRLSSTGLAVTGTLSATGLISGRSSNGQAFTTTNGDDADFSITLASGDVQLINTASSSKISTVINGTARTQVSSTGLAVTGTLSATKRAYTSATAVSFSATPTFDASTTNIIVFGNLTANVTSMTMSNAQEGQFLSIRFRQDATGSRTVALPSGAKVNGAITATANLTSYLNITYNATDSRWEGNWSNIPA